MLGGCQTLGLNGAAVEGGVSATEISEMLSQPRAIPTLVKEGEAALKAKDADKAQRLFSAALKLDITNPDLQFLNGLAYHLIGISKDRTKLELAEQGLNLALKFDPGHLAARYQLGLLYSYELIPSNHLHSFLQLVQKEQLVKQLMLIHQFSLSYS